MKYGSSREMHFADQSGVLVLIRLPSGLLRLTWIVLDLKHWCL